MSLSYDHNCQRFITAGHGNWKQTTDLLYMQIHARRRARIEAGAATNLARYVPQSV